MTQKEKIELLKDTIYKLYSNEGRSKSYISKLLNVNRKDLTYKINEWNFVQANSNHLTPSNEKFANKNKDLIISRFNSNISEMKIAKELNVNRDFLRNIISKTPELKNAKDTYLFNKTKKKDFINSRKNEYKFDDYDGEIWKEIEYYNGYFVSNYGRIKSYKKSYDAFKLIKPSMNIKSGRLYVKIGDKNLQLARLVGHAFVEGYSGINNTIDHIDRDVTNNHADNLIWASQSVNNKNSKNKNVAYKKYGRFKKIILDDKYEFKTLTALAKFLNISTTQLNRYIDGETKSKYKFKFIY